MVTVCVAGRAIRLPALLLAKRPTRDEKAWLSGEYLTLQLLEPVGGVRAHTNDRAFRDRPASKGEGAWVAIDDFLESAGDFASSRALPGIGVFTHVAWVVLLTDCIINVGVCGPHRISKGAGGGIQAEHVGGPMPRFTQLKDKYWHSRYGHA